MVNKSNFKKNKISHCNYPSKAGVADFTKNMAVYLFPIIEGGECYPISRSKLKSQLKSLLEPIKDRIQDNPKVIADAFFEEMPFLKKLMVEDAVSIATGDPAALELDVVILAYPGFFAIMVYRLAHCLAGLGVPIVPRIMTEHAHSTTGIDINPKAKIGSEFFIDHGTGIVIGETAVIGNRVKLYQGVTIGALSIKKAMAAAKRHPTIEDDVIIYAGSTILGGETTIGHDSIIGGNVWLTESVPPFSLVYHKSQITIRDRDNKKV